MILVTRSSIYKYISTQLGDKTQVDHRGGEPQPFLSMKRTPSSNKMKYEHRSKKLFKSFSQSEN